MKPKIICILFLLHGLSAFALDANSKIKYPYALLTDDYNILSEKDLFLNMVSPNPYPLTDKPDSWDLWQCFKTTDVSFQYSNMGYEKDWGSVIGDLSITVLDKGSPIHTYWFPRPYPVSLCNKWIKTWKKLIKNEEHFCIGGHFVDYDAKIKDARGLFARHWMFSRLKTKKGCWDRITKC
jgi:hypothetical protein